MGTSYLDSVYPWYPSSYSCGLWFKAYYHYFDVGTYIPARGDMILFDTPMELDIRIILCW